MKIKSPCEECVLLAICKGQTQIYREILIEMFNDIDYQNDEIAKEIWDTIHKSLPGVITVAQEKR